MPWYTVEWQAVLFGSQQIEADSEEEAESLFWREGYDLNQYYVDEVEVISIEKEEDYDDGGTHGDGDLHG